MTDAEVQSEELVRLHDDVNKAIEELRSTLRQLRSSVSDGQPFGQVAADVISDFARRTGIQAEFVEETDCCLAVPVENELLHILQEALSNVDKHSNADTAWVRWVVDADQATLSVVDDGHGFQPDAAHRHDAFGLIGMRERADAIGARIEIDSSPQNGTAVVVTVAATSTVEEVRAP